MAMTKAQQQEISSVKTQMQKNYDSMQVLVQTGSHLAGAIKLFEGYMSTYRQDPVMRQLRDDIIKLSKVVGNEQNKRSDEMYRCRDRLNRIDPTHIRMQQAFHSNVQ